LISCRARALVVTEKSPKYPWGAQGEGATRLGSEGFKGLILFHMSYVYLQHNVE